MSSHILLATVLSLVALCARTASTEPAPAQPQLPQINPCDPAWQKADYAPAEVKDWPGPKDLAHFEYRLYKGSARWIGNAKTPGAARDARSPKDHRAIVKVDIHPANGKSQCLDDPHAWYLAVIPMKSADALRAVDEYFRVEPIFPHVLGYCYPANPGVKGCTAATAADKRTGGDDQHAKEGAPRNQDAEARPRSAPKAGPPDGKASSVSSGMTFCPGPLLKGAEPTHEVVTYDPKCVCNSVDGVIDIVQY